MSVPCVLFRVARSFTLLGASGGLLRRSSVLCRTAITRKITSKMDHLERTASNYRQSGVYSARVCGIMEESETVKRLRLAVHADFTFRAGQWVDFFIPGVEKAGGFSICSSPGLLQREGVIELAVKYTQHPPAHWIHTRCVVDSLVEMRVGGDFFYDPLPSDPSVDLLLVAGGVGINPLYSILTHAADLLRQNPHNTEGGYNIGSTHLCYSAKNTQELLFKKNIIDICQEFPDKFSCDFHVTAQTTEFDPQLQPYVNRGRVSKEKLRGHVDPDTTLCYLCGPPPMIESLVQTLLDSGLSQDRILFEKWW
ncbi:oxidoreductase NAD-binding domain-containing protein 1 isoform X2 [Esox lucius]|uniref:Oxidoreductase NAD-binding domain-containing protein 1 n=1 Tax=Esox lucius TaxID=8010 RepID=A0AAY5KXD6_ESOLU|nr:oxidoreductase NAD-binding domain-containing protein 1 isoform X2 [Esox lucius]